MSCHVIVYASPSRLWRFPRLAPPLAPFVCRFPLLTAETATNGITAIVDTPPQPFVEGGDVRKKCDRIFLFVQSVAWNLRRDYIEDMVIKEDYYPSKWPRCVTSSPRYRWFLSLVRENSLVHSSVWSRGVFASIVPKTDAKALASTCLLTRSPPALPTTRLHCVQLGERCA